MSRVENENTFVLPAQPSKRLGVVQVLGLLLAGSLSLVLAGVALTTREPDWWSKSAPTGDVRTQGSSAEHRVIAEASRVRSEFGTQWEVSLTQDECNAWLAQRFPEWVASMREPSAIQVSDASTKPLQNPIEQPQVRVCFDGEAPVIGVRDAAGHLVWAKIAWNNGAASVQQYGVGSVGIPHMIAKQNQQVARLEQVIDDATREAVRLPDGRRVRIMRLHSEAGVVKLAGMTLGSE